jgi:hypothetical protein
MKDLLHAIIDSLRDLFWFCGIMLLFVFIYAVVGRQIFDGRLTFPDDNGDMVRTRWHFDSFSWSLVTVFQVMSSQHWYYVLQDCVHAIGWPGAVYVVSLYVIGNWLVLSLFLALMLGNFEKAHHHQHPMHHRDKKLKLPPAPDGISESLHYDQGPIGPPGKPPTTLPPRTPRRQRSTTIWQRIQSYFDTWQGEDPNPITVVSTTTPSAPPSRPGSLPPSPKNSKGKGSSQRTGTSVGEARTANDESLELYGVSIDAIPTATDRERARRAGLMSMEDMMAAVLEQDDAKRESVVVTSSGSIDPDEVSPTSTAQQMIADAHAHDTAIINPNDGLTDSAPLTTRHLPRRPITFGTDSSDTTNNDTNNEEEKRRDNVFESSIATMDDGSSVSVTSPILDTLVKDVSSPSTSSLSVSFAPLPSSSIDESNEPLARAPPALTRSASKLPPPLPSTLPPLTEVTPMPVVQAVTDTKPLEVEASPPSLVRQPSKRAPPPLPTSGASVTTPATDNVDSPPSLIRQPSKRVPPPLPASTPQLAVETVAEPSSVSSAIEPHVAPIIAALETPTPTTPTKRAPPLPRSDTKAALESTLPTPTTSIDAPPPFPTILDRPPTSIQDTSPSPSISIDASPTTKVPSKKHTRALSRASTMLVADDPSLADLLSNDFLAPEPEPTAAMIVSPLPPFPQELLDRAQSLTLATPLLSSPAPSASPRSSSLSPHTNNGTASPQYPGLSTLGLSLPDVLLHSPVPPVVPSPSFSTIIGSDATDVSPLATPIDDDNKSLDTNKQPKVSFANLPPPPFPEVLTTTLPVDTTLPPALPPPRRPSVVASMTSLPPPPIPSVAPPAPPPPPVVPPLPSQAVVDEATTSPARPPVPPTLPRSFSNRRLSTTPVPTTPSPTPPSIEIPASTPSTLASVVIPPVIVTSVASKVPIVISRATPPPLPRSNTSSALLPATPSTPMIASTSMVPSPAHVATTASIETKDQPPSLTRARTKPPPLPTSTSPSESTPSSPTSDSPSAVATSPSATPPTPATVQRRPSVSSSTAAPPAKTAPTPNTFTPPRRTSIRGAAKQSPTTVSPAKSIPTTPGVAAKSTGSRTGGALATAAKKATPTSISSSSGSTTGSVPTLNRASSSSVGSTVRGKMGTRAPLSRRPLPQLPSSSSLLSSSTGSQKKSTTGATGSTKKPTTTTATATSVGAKKAPPPLPPPPPPPHAPPPPLPSTPPPALPSNTSMQVNSPSSSVVGGGSVTSLSPTSAVSVEPAMRLIITDEESKLVDANGSTIRFSDDTMNTRTIPRDISDDSLTIQSSLGRNSSSDNGNSISHGRGSATLASLFVDPHKNKHGDIQLNGKHGNGHGSSHGSKPHKKTAPLTTTIPHHRRAGQSLFTRSGGVHHAPLQGRSLCCMWSSNPLRVKVDAIVSHRWFNLL